MVVGEASDGQQAIQRAKELQPDLILLDLALPKLNGMEAGRRIRKISRQSKIIFLSQNSAPDIVESALALEPEICGSPMLTSFRLRYTPFSKVESL